jgi:DNA-directed RNA polymerase I subunit RPA2
MPFAENSGISPDIIINPHAFPSRMTIGMLIESIAGKAGAVHGISYQDATPFTFHEDIGSSAEGKGSKDSFDEGEPETCVSYFCDQLRRGGYNYYGHETLINGCNGQVMRADIFMGVVYYQRLRHMVSDKAQVRATGRVQQLTRQPVHGRKNKGGIRLGEMERDALLSYGLSYFVVDRFMNSSDRHLAHICKNCQSLLSVHEVTGQQLRETGRSSLSSSPSKSRAQDRILSKKGENEKRVIRRICRNCLSTNDDIVKVSLPYVYRYLVNELAMMGVKVDIATSSG